MRRSVVTICLGLPTATAASLQAPASASPLTAASSSCHLRRVVGGAIVGAGVSSSGSSSALSSSFSVFPQSAGGALCQQQRHRSARFGVRSDEDHIAERNRNAAERRASANKKKEDLYEFTGMVNTRTGSRNVPLGMDSDAEGDRNVLKANPLLILRKVEEDKGGKIVKAIKKLQGKPDSMQLTEEQQSDLVNAYAETKWFAVFWRPFANVNYTRARRYRLMANIGLTLCIVITITLMFLVSYSELLTFCELEEWEQAEYRHIILHVPIGVIKAMGDELLKQYDPNETLTLVERARLTLAEMRRLGWHTMDWEVEAPRQFKPWYETWDYVHCFFWASMWVGSMAAGGGAYYSSKNTFGRIEQQATQRREEARRREASAGFVGSVVVPSAAAAAGTTEGAVGGAISDAQPQSSLPVKEAPKALGGAMGWLLSK